MSGKDRLQQTLQNIARIADTVAEPLGLCVVDVRFGQQGKKRTLEVTIHRRQGAVSLDDCEHVSRSLEQVLDAEAALSGPLIEGAYMLEVQSPGIDRALKTEREFSVFAGHQVSVSAKEKIQALGTRFTATLVGIDNGKVLLSQAKSQEAPGKNKEVGTAQEVTIELSKLAQIKLHADLPQKSKRNN